MTAVDNAERGMEESFCLELTPRPKYDVGHKIFFYSRAIHMGIPSVHAIFSVCYLNTREHTYMW